MPNVHTPERAEGETQAEYRYRQKASKRLGILALRGRANLSFYQNRDGQGNMRRREISAAGGFRQWKRARMAPLRALKSAPLERAKPAEVEA